MHLIRFLDYLDEWKIAKKYKQLSNKVYNDCISKDGDLSFFLIKGFSGDFLADEILNVVCRFVFNNFKRWEDSSKQHGAVIIPRKAIERKVKNVTEEEPAVLNTIHCNMENVLSKESTKLHRLIYKYRKQSYYYSLSSIENILCSLSSDDWNQLFALSEPKNVYNIACKLNKEFFRGNNHKAPQELLNRIANK